ncbi:MAG: hypothetical protein RRY76_05435 [Clostridia bacterium]
MEHFRLAVEIVAGIGVLCAFVIPLYRRIKASEKGLVAMLHDRIYQACIFYLNRGWVTIEDMRNLEYMYKPYAAMGGNGTAKELYERVLDLQIKEDEE